MEAGGGKDWLAGVYSALSTLWWDVYSLHFSYFLQASMEKNRPTILNTLNRDCSAINSQRLLWKKGGLSFVLFASKWWKKMATNNPEHLSNSWRVQCK